jgi:hypothetical protein
MGLVVKKQLSACSRQKGLAMVEFTILLPLLLMFFVAVAEFGILFFTHTTLTKTVENGARFLANNSIDQVNRTVIDAGSETIVKNLVVYGNAAGTGSVLIDGMTTADVSVDCLYGAGSLVGGKHCIEQDNITPIIVTAQIQYKPVLGDFMKNLLGIDLNIPLGASAVNVTF